MILLLHFPKAEAVPGQKNRLALPIVNFFLVDYSAQRGRRDRLPVVGARSVKNARLAAVRRLRFSRRDTRNWVRTCQYSPLTTGKWTIVH